MTDYQNNRYNMLVAVYAVLISFHDVWKNRASFAAQVTRLGGVLDALQKPMQDRGKDNTGVAKGKAGLKLKGAHKADYIGDIIQGYAIDAGDDDLYRSMMFSFDDVMKMAAPEALAKMREVWTKGTKLYEDHLKNEGLTQDDLDELKADADGFEEKMPQVRTAIGEKKEAGEEIDEGISEGAAAVHRMSKSINTFASASTSLVSEFKSASIIVDAGHGGSQKA